MNPESTPGVQEIPVCWVALILSRLFPLRPCRLGFGPSLGLRITLEPLSFLV